MVSFVLGRGWYGSENLRHRRDGGEFLPLGFSGLQFIDALAAWLDRTFVAANGCVVRLVCPLEAGADFVEVPKECAESLVQLLRRLGDGSGIF